MTTSSELGRLVAEERGGVLVLFAISLTVLLLFAAFALDVGNWFTHKRDLQKQADAAALAGGGRFTFPCDNTAVEAEARKYSGDSGATHNKEKPADPSRTHVLVNSERFWNEGGTNYSDGGPPCNARFVDVKVTEADIPLFFKMIPGFAGVLPAVNARARVEARALDASANTLPIAIPEVGPKVARAIFVNEATGVEIASTPLTKGADVNGLTIWDNAAAPVSVPISAGAANIGVRVALGGQTSTTCNQQFVICYDGLVHIRGWSSTPTVTATDPPQARDVTLMPGSAVVDGSSCQDPYFSSANVPCGSIGVAATMDFDGTGTDPRPTTGAKVSAVVGGVEKPLDYDAATNQWVSSPANEFAFAAGSGPNTVTLKWETTLGKRTVSKKLQTCSAATNNPCTDTIANVQRTFATTDDRSGPIKLAQVWEGGIGWANSFQQGTTRDLVVRLGIEGNFRNATSVNDPLVRIRVAGGSQSGSIDCDPDWPNIDQELGNGCRPLYAVNKGTPCPTSSNNQQWPSTPPAWECVAVQTGGAVGQVNNGMKQRILGGSNTCPTTLGAVGRNNWSMFPHLPPDDPRIVSVFLVPFGSLNVSGNTSVPVTNFATFYVTGWSGSPCAGDDPADSGMIVGHYIKHIFGLNTGGGGTQLCDFAGVGSCIAVMTH